MKKELVKFANGASYDVQNIRSTDNALDFEVQDVDKNALETILADKDNVGIIKYMQKDTDTQDEESVTDQEMEEELGTENVDGAETE